jgi:hypothetical protein
MIQKEKKKMKIKMKKKENKCLVPPPRIELGRGLTPLDFESSASTSSAKVAKRHWC